jgi:hypothetical protein
MKATRMHCKISLDLAMNTQTQAFDSLKLFVENSVYISSLL